MVIDQTDPKIAWATIIFFLVSTIVLYMIVPLLSWSDREGPSPSVDVTVRLTPLGGDTAAFLTAGAARALKGSSVVLVTVTGGDDAADVAELLDNPEPE
jgi:hypothetical protein